MSEKHKNVCRGLITLKNFFSSVSGCISISAFASLVTVPEGITISTVGLTIRSITAGTKNYKSIMKKERKKHDKIGLFA